MDLLKLDINQCPDKYYVPNAFKSTDKCDQKTSYVSKPIGLNYNKMLITTNRFSVYQSSVADLNLVAINVNVNRDTNIPLKI